MDSGFLGFIPLSGRTRPRVLAVYRSGLVIAPLPQEVKYGSGNPLSAPFEAVIQALFNRRVRRKRAELIADAQRMAPEQLAARRRRTFIAADSVGHASLKTRSSGGATLALTLTDGKALEFNLAESSVTGGLAQPLLQSVFGYRYIDETPTGRGPARLGTDPLAAAGAAALDPRRLTDVETAPLTPTKRIRLQRRLAWVSAVALATGVAGFSATAARAVIDAQDAAQLSTAVPCNAKSGSNCYADTSTTITRVSPSTGSQFSPNSVFLRVADDSVAYEVAGGASQAITVGDKVTVRRWHGKLTTFRLASGVTLASDQDPQTASLTNRGMAAILGGWLVVGPLVALMLLRRRLRFWRRARDLPEPMSLPTTVRPCASWRPRVRIVTLTAGGAVGAVGLFLNNPLLMVGAGAGGSLASFGIAVLVTRRYSIRLTHDGFEYRNGRRAVTARWVNVVGVAERKGKTFVRLRNRQEISLVPFLGLNEDFERFILAINSLSRTE